MPSLKNRTQILEGSRAIALTIKNIRPGVVSAYPITPQTHIVEDLAMFKAEGGADYEYVRAESEFAAASIVEGASATGVRVYTASSSQGLLLMAEVLFNIAGMRLPVVLTCANRAVSAPINIWNDQQDAMTVRDSGWIMLFAENLQETVMQHILAYKIAENLMIPVMLNIDGFVLTHSYEPVVIPDEKTIKKFLPPYKPAKGTYLDPRNPVTLGAFASPAHYMEIRQELHEDQKSALELIKKEDDILKKTLNLAQNSKLKAQSLDNGLIEYYGPSNPETIVVAMGSVVGTIKDAVDEMNTIKHFKLHKPVGVLKVKCYRPFPADEIMKAIGPAKYVAVMDKSISLGNMGPLAADIKAASFGRQRLTKIQSFIVGLGGRDITKEIVKKIIKEVRTGDDGVRFVGKV
jgi:pyruvate ferredoxin oxidoreductase alpha subunit